MKCADLHIHSIYSDGMLTPHQIIDIAYENKVNIISITDHDTIDGYKEILGYETKGVCVVPGIEFSTYDVESVHILGYNINLNSERLKKYSKDKKQHDAFQFTRILLGLRKLGVRVDIENMKSVYGRINVKNLMSYLVEKGLSKDVDSAYKICYSMYPEREKKLWSIISTRSCIEMIHELGGIAVWAHPLFVSKDYDAMKNKVILYKTWGLDGIECIHPRHNNFEKELCLRLAYQYNLKVTGGSDYHGGKEEKSKIGYIESYGKIYGPFL